MFGIDDMAAASLVSTGVSALGGIFGKKGPSLKSLNKQAEVQYNWQRKLNQTAIQDKVADATKAGIHPLYAISGQTNQGGISMPTGDEPDNERFSRMGQNIERAVTAYSTRGDRALMQKSTMLDLERKQLENEVLKNQALGSRLSLQRQAGQPPANQSVAVNPSEIEANRPGDPATVAGVPPATQEFINRDGNISVMPSEQQKSKMDDDILLQMEWYYRNKIIPSMRKYRMFDPWNYTKEYYYQKRKGG